MVSRTGKATEFKKKGEMSASIAISAKPTKDKLKKALNEIKQLKVIQQDVNLPWKTKASNVKNKKKT